MFDVKIESKNSVENFGVNILTMGIVSAETNKPGNIECKLNGSPAIFQITVTHGANIIPINAPCFVTPPI